MVRLAQNCACFHLQNCSLITNRIYRYFMDYSIHNELKLGLGMDLTALLYAATIAFKDNKEREYYAK